MENWIPVCIVVTSVLVLLYLFSNGFYTFDFYIHSRIAELYKSSWFSTFDQKIGMIDLKTYPPLAHQILAVSRMFLPTEPGFNLVLALSLIGFAYFFSKFSVEYLKLEDKNFWLLYLVLLTSPGILMLAFVFGQITSIVGFAFGSISLYYLSKFFSKDDERYLLISELALLLVAFSNVIAFIITSIIYGILCISEYRRFMKRIGKVLKLSILPALMLISIYYPFIQNAASETLIPVKEIIHFSRYPFALEINAERWYSIYGFSLLMTCLPIFVFITKQKNTRKFLILYSISMLLLLFGLGRTTHATKVFLDFEYWLTYERFVFMSATMLWVFFVYYIPNLPNVEVSYNGKTFELIKILIVLLIVLSNLNDLHKSHSLFFNGATTGHYDPYRAEITEYVLSFLNNSEKLYRYQTLGYGRSIGEIYLYSPLPTLDSDYYTGRTVEWIRNSGYSEIDQINNTTFLDEFMERADEHSVKYIITFNEFHEDRMESWDWKVVDKRTFPTRTVTIWENPNTISEVPDYEEGADWVNYARGMVPMIVLLIFSALHINHRRLK